MKTIELALLYEQDHIGVMPMVRNAIVNVRRHWSFGREPMPKVMAGIENFKQKYYFTV
jgi:hypothetical protein